MQKSLVIILGWILCNFASAVPDTQQELKGYFGAQLGNVEEGVNDKAKGVAVVSVLPNSPAAAAGFQVDDIITHVDNFTSSVPGEVAQYLGQVGVDGKVEISYMRKGKLHHTKLTLGLNPWQFASEPDPAADYPVVVQSDLTYQPVSKQEKHKLDLYMPQAPQPVAALLWIHGGGWSFGDRKNERALALRFAERGVAVAVMSYRLSGGRWADENAAKDGVTHPAHVNDVADAFAWLISNATRLGIDKRSIFVGGHSAGAHLAALLVSDAQYLQARGLGLTDVAGAIPIGGAYDIVDYHKALVASDPVLGNAHIQAVFGQTKKQWRHASPTQYLAASDRPMLVVVEEQAGFQRYAKRLQRAARKADRDNIIFYDAKDRVHGNVILLMSGRHEDEVRAQMIDYIQKVAGLPASTPGGAEEQS